MFFDRGAYLLEDEGEVELESSRSTVPVNLTTAGLGYETRRPRETSEALAKRLEGKQRRHRKTKRLPSAGEELAVIPSHGTQDDDDEQLLANRYKKRPAVATVETGSKDDAKQQLTHAIREEGRHAPPADGRVDGTSNGSAVEAPMGNRIQDSSDRDDGTERRRRKTKTRSKQKNIRRDRRPDHLKPEHIRNGEGRRLSEATIARLGLTAAAPLPNNDEVPNDFPIFFEG